MSGDEQEIQPEEDSFSSVSSEKSLQKSAHTRTKYNSQIVAQREKHAR